MALDIAIVGAGVAGLCAAVAFRQGGHSVRVGSNLKNVPT